LIARRLRKEHKLQLELVHQAIDIVTLRLTLDQAFANLAQCVCHTYISERLGPQGHLPIRLEKQDEAIA